MQNLNKMSRIIGTLEIDFETGKTITQEQYDKFERKLNKMVEDWEMMVYDAAEECGFEADSIHPILLDNLDCDFDEE